MPRRRLDAKQGGHKDAGGGAAGAEPHVGASTPITA